VADNKQNLSPKEQKFVDLVAKGYGHADAAKEAGYSARSAGTLAARLLKRPEINDGIQARREYFRSIADVDAKDIIGAQVEIAFASIEDALDDKGNLDFAKAKQNGSAKLIKRISRSDTKYGENVSIEFYSRSDALGQLSEILGLKQMPRENATTLERVLRSYNLWVEKNPGATNEDKAEAITTFAKGGNIDERLLAQKVGIDLITETPQ
jgi:hypothetical protein